MPLATLFIVVGALLLACTGAESPGDATPDANVQPDASEAPRNEPSTTPRASSGRSFSVSSSASAAPSVVTGTFGFGAVEGGCAFLETPNGERYEVIYPRGWRLDRSTGSLIGPEGQVVRSGDTITVRGSITNDIASICQVGPMFRATEVVEAPR